MALFYYIPSRNKIAVRRTNTFAVRPLTDEDETLLRTLLNPWACL